LISQKIYLIRHGQTDYNLQGIVQGSGVDASLNDTGRAQAQAFYKAYRHISFDRVYTSKLKRSQESVASFVKDGTPSEAVAGLNEISWGSKEGQRITPEEDEYYHWMLKQWQMGQTHIPIEGGESPEEVAERQRPFIESLRSSGTNGNILVCMHGRAMRILLCQLMNYPLRSMDMFEHDNLGLYLLNRSGSLFTIELYNNRDHLTELIPVQTSAHASVTK
jgi:broad specificity phosphatase PhoE